MTRTSRVAALGLIIVAVILAFGLTARAKATPPGFEAPTSLAAQTIYPAGGSDGPPSP